jgi:pyridoxal phosphate enzyme (YggS family)
MPVAENLQLLERRIAAACARAGRPREDVTLIAVSKTFPADAVDEAIAAGITDIGENRVQEFRDKMPGIGRRARWHMIGHLQSNKAKDAVRLFDVIQTIDSLALAEKVAREAEKQGRRIDVMIEVNAGGEEQKSGVSPDAAPDLALSIGKFGPVLALTGLMTVPPIAEDYVLRKCFTDMRALRDVIEQQSDRGTRLHLSMGMSDDFEVAIEEGSTMIRLGRAIFGSRG